MRHDVQFSLPFASGDPHPAARALPGSSGERERPSVPRGMAHRGGLDTEREAAARIERKLNALHDEVLAAFQARGPMDAREAERLAQFSHLGPSTIRKRISELFHAGRLIADGKRDGLTVWRVAPTTPGDPAP